MVNTHTHDRRAASDVYESVTEHLLFVVGGKGKSGRRKAEKSHDVQPLDPLKRRVKLQLSFTTLKGGNSAEFERRGEFHNF